MSDRLDTNIVNRKSLSTGRVVGFGLLIFLSQFIIQVFVLIGLYIFEAIRGSTISVEEVVGNGLFLALVTILSGIVGVAFIILITRYFQGRSFLEYLGLTGVSLKQLGFWLFIAAVFLVLSDTCTFLLKKPIVTDFMVNAVQTAKFPWLLYFALIIAAPIFEELFYRGFLLKGLSLSWLKPFGAIVLTALCWSLLHMQYDWYGVLQIFLGGLLFGYARLKSGSIYVTIAMHGLQNLVATIETIIMMQ